MSSPASTPAKHEVHALQSDMAPSFEHLLEAVAPLLTEHLAQSDAGSHAGADAKITREWDADSVEALLQALDQPAQARPAQPTQALEQAVSGLLQYSVPTASARFLDKLYAGTDAVGCMSELVAAVLNTNAHTFQVAPAIIAAELLMLQRVRTLLGWPVPLRPSPADGTTATASAARQAHPRLHSVQDGDGIMCPGGSFANMLAVYVARARAVPGVAQHGMAAAAQPLAMFLSSQAHYSATRAAAMLGLGTASVVKVAVDSAGAMLPAALDEAISAAVAAGQRPFCVIATAGTTVLGAFDPFSRIADVVDAWDARLAGAEVDLQVLEHSQPACAASAWPRRQLWLHVDGALGGPAIFLPEGHAKAAEVDVLGLARADSFVINPHKLLGVPIQCTVLVNKGIGVQRHACASSAAYLFHDHELAELDVGDRTLMCGRRADAVKLYLAWQYWGTAGLQARVLRALELAAYMQQRIEEHPALCLAACRTWTNTLFWYVPRTDRGTCKPSAAWGTAVADIAARMRASGKFLLEHQPLTAQAGLPRAFRFVVASPRVTKALIDELITHIVELGDRLEEL